MHTSFHLRWFGSLAIGLTVGLSPLAAQMKMQVEIVNGKLQAQSPDRPDETKAMLKEVQEAYKAPFEVDKDIRDELRKQYQNPNPDREQKILREARRLYATTPEQEERIVRELRRAYEAQSPEQEERVFTEIRRGGKLPVGTVPASVQNAQAERLFQRFDSNRDGVLGRDELPDGLVAAFGKWDANRDGVIDAREYWGYYQASLRSVSEKVASGELSVKLPNGTLPPKPAPAPTDEEYKLQVFRAGKLPQGLPAWFTRLDTDGDGQVGLYEWRAGGGDLEEFNRMDVNGDGLLTAEEYLQWKKETDLAAKKGVQESQSPSRLGQPGTPPAVAVKTATPKPTVPEVKPGPNVEKKLDKILIKSGEAPPKGEGKDRPKPQPGEKK
jgi:EF hand